MPGWPRLGELVTLGKGGIPGSLEKRAEPDSSGPKGGGAAPARTSKQGSDWGRRLEALPVDSPAPVTPKAAH